jgi:hypothetical protein
MMLCTQITVIGTHLPAHNSHRRPYLLRKSRKSRRTGSVATRYANFGFERGVP